MMVVEEVIKAGFVVFCIEWLVCKQRRIRKYTRVFTLVYGEA